MWKLKTFAIIIMCNPLLVSIFDIGIWNIGLLYKGLFLHKSLLSIACFSNNFDVEYFAPFAVKREGFSFSLPGVSFLFI